MHFPPDFPVAHDELELLNYEELVRAAQKCGVRYLVAGHRHVQRTYQVGGGSVVVICAGSATSVDVGDAGNSFLDIEVRVSAGIIESVGYRAVNYDATRAAFHPAVWEEC